MKRNLLIAALAICATAMSFEAAAQPRVTYGQPTLKSKNMARDENNVLNIPLWNKSQQPLKTTLQVQFVREDNAVMEETLMRCYSRVVEVAAGAKDTIRWNFKASDLQTWRNGSKTVAPGKYTLFVGDALNNGRSISTRLIVDDVTTIAENSYGAKYVDHNPFKDALLPVPETAIFRMEGYSLWCPSVIEHEGKFHLFCSRWVEGTHWGCSEIIRASSDNLYGPYEFEEVTLSPKSFPYSFGKTGLHNPKIIKIDDYYYLYYLALPAAKTAMARAKSPEGPWEVIDHIVIQTNNPAICQNEDGSIYVVGKENIELPQGGHFRSMPAFRAKSILGKYKPIEKGKSRLPYKFEHEDPTIWRAENGYNIIFTDWAGNITNEQKSVVYFTSKDGVKFDLVSPVAIWRTSDAVPVSYDNGAYTKDIYIQQVERPEVHLNDKGEVDALLVGAIPPRYGNHSPVSFIIIRPVDNFVPEK